MTFPKNIWVFVNDEGAFEVGRTDTEDDLEAEYALSVVRKIKIVREELSTNPAASASEAHVSTRKPPSRGEFGEQADGTFVVPKVEG